jgi:proteasome lid subunit RPN8/RPN11
MRALRRTPGAKTPKVAGLDAVSEAVVYPHVFANGDREVGGVLVGRAPRRGGLPLVTGAIEALQADEQRATLTFTQDAWAHVHRTLDERFPEDEQIVGWYHSHPGFGIFLSGHDMFIHENFFSGDSQIALVVDPHAGTEGVFVWRDGEVVPLFEQPTPGGWEPVGAQPAPPPGDSPADRRTPAAVSRQGVAVTPAAACVLGIVAGLLLWFVIRPTDEPESAPAKPAVEQVEPPAAEPAPEPDAEPEPEPEPLLPQNHEEQPPAPGGTDDDAPFDDLQGEKTD